MWYMFQNTPTNVNACVSTKKPQTCNASTVTMDLTVMCCLHTDRDEVCYDYESVNEDYKLGILKCSLQPVFVFPLHFFSHSYRASWYYQSFFIHQLMHKWIVLKTISILLPNSATHTHTNKDPLIYAATSPHTDIF
jgi:hypothetical protein